MYLSPEMIHYFQQLNSYLQYQNQQIHEMNQLIQQLIQELNQLKEKNAQPPVIKNEYKFDLLKVERLMGTLNIGIKPDGTGSTIDEFAVNQSLQMPELEQKYPELIEEIRRRIGEYMNQDAYKALIAYENKYQRPLDETFRKFILEDVKKQIDSRIRYYLNHLHPEQAEPERFAQVERQVIENVKRDIEQTLETFIKNLPRNEGNQHGI